VAEDARLKTLPFVALPTRRAREEKPDARVVGERPDLLEGPRGLARASRPSWGRQEIRVARIDDGGESVRADLVGDLVGELLSREARVLERDVALPISHTAVPREKKVEDGLLAARLGLCHVPCGFPDRSLELGAARRDGLGRCLAVEARGVLVGPRE